tara:strand:+ start:323 stop:598 length:276 start_codon:yes stop_codon:yes gene_type:complete
MKHTIRRQLVEDACKCTELNHFLDIISTDDNKEIDDYTDAEIIAEAQYVSSLYTEGGTAQSECLSGDCGKISQRNARRELKELKWFLKKHS